MGSKTIRTPDQRLRVFVSSTIQELAPERARARDMITGLRLTPVMFEMGARPHPPRDLYRSYLAQSDIFLGIYWQSYGWIAPTMDVSGLEDEFQLSEGMPRLIYLKEPAQDRDPRLVALLAAVRSSDSVAYQRFSTAEQLAELIADDLAVLLSERFAVSEEPTEVFPGPRRAPRALPATRGSLLGRDRETAELEDLLTSDSCRLVTLTGPGGTGKSRLAIEVGRRVSMAYRDGVCFVSLGEVSTADEVADAFGRDLGLHDSGKQPIEATLIEYLADKQMLLVTDNFEHVLEAGTILSRLLDRAPEIRVLATSRAPLRLTAEHEYAVEPLAHPRGTPSEYGLELDFPAVALFIERAREANPKLALDAAQIEAVADIARALDGLPLAIELAAARTKFLDPQTLGSRMGNTLDMLARGARDLPSRQQTMRAAIKWSQDLLSDTGQRVFRRMAVLSGASRLESIEAVANWEGDLDVTLLDEVENLVDLGLVRVSMPESGDGPRFWMLRTVRDYALEQLELSSEKDEAHRLHGAHFLELAEEAEPYLWRSDRGPWLDHLTDLFANLRAAFVRLVEQERRELSWRLAAALGPYLTLRGSQGEGIRLLELLGIDPDNPPAEVPTVVAGAVMREIGILLAMTGRFVDAAPVLRRAVELLEEGEDLLGAARAMGYLGISGISTGDPSAMTSLARGLELGSELNDLYSTVVASTFTAEISLAFGDQDGARQYAINAGALCREAGDQWLEGLALMQRGSIAIVADDIEEALAVTSESHQLLTETQSSLVGWPKVGLGYCHLRVGAADVAAKHFDDSIESGRRTGDKTVVLGGLIGLAGVAATLGDGPRAARLLGAVDSIREAIGYQLWSATLTMYTMVEERVRGTGSAEDVARLRAEGGALSYDQAVVLAIS